MLAFTIAVFLFFITPGPGVLSVAGVGSAFGAGPGKNYIAGLCVGNNLVVVGNISGLAALIFADKNIRLLLLIVSLGYLLFLAAKIAFAGTTIAFGNPRKPPGFIDGIVLQTLNPKA